MQSIKDKILARIRGHGKGCVFCGRDFLDLGNRSAVDKALCDLATQGNVRRLMPGIYDFPRYDAELGGILSPDIHRVVQTIARKNGVRIQPSGAWAANMLRLSNQVPAKRQYFTDGRSRNIRVGNRIVQLKHASPRDMLPGSDVGVLVTRALRYLGREHVDNKVITHLRNILTARDRKCLMKDARKLEDWLWEAAQKIGQPSVDGGEADG